MVFPPALSSTDQCRPTGTNNPPQSCLFPPRVGCASMRGQNRARACATTFTQAILPTLRNCSKRSLDERSDSIILDPGQDLAGEGIAILLEHHHMAVAFNSVIAEIKEIRLRAVLIKPLDYGPVQLARMIDIRGSSHHQDALATIVRQIGDLELAAANIAAL